VGGNVVLVVEDDADTMELSRIALEIALGVRVVTAEDGREAVHLAHEDRPALVLLDMMLPDMDGFEVAKQLKASPRTRNIPIIAVTASTSREQAIAAGCNDFIQKPFQLDYYLDRIQKHLRSDVQAARY